MLDGRLKRISRLSKDTRKVSNYLPTKTLASWGIFSSLLFGVESVAGGSGASAGATGSGAEGERGGEVGRVSKRVPQVRMRREGLEGMVA